jgi:hypothetical protein
MNRIIDPLFNYKVNANEQDAYFTKYGERESTAAVSEFEENLGSNEFMWDAIPDLTQGNLYILKYRGNQPRNVLDKYPELWYGGIDLITVLLNLNPTAKAITFRPNSRLLWPGIHFSKQRDNVLFGNDLRTKREVICTLYGSISPNGIYLPDKVKIQINGVWADDSFTIGKPSIWNKY